MPTLLPARRLRRCTSWAAALVTGLALTAVAAPAMAQASAISAAPAQPPACPVAGSAAQPLYTDTRYTFAQRAADLVSCMTLAEKVQQLHTNNAPAIPRLGVQQYTYWSEGQHGVNRLGADTSAGGQGELDAAATSFPVNFASTMSWDPQLVYAETSAISDEARGFLDKSLFGTGENNLGPSASDYGSLTYWAPTVNMDRDPRWGRTDEAFGEDPYLASQMSDAFVEGYQGETMSGQMMTPYLKAASTAKHFAMNNEEDDRTSGSSDTTDANVRDYYTRQFQSLTEDAHVSGIMTSYNAINGTPSPTDTYTTNELLQRTYGFDGYTTSDCDAVGTAFQEPPGGHAWAAPGWTSSQDGGQIIWTNNTTGAVIPAAAGAEAYALRAGTQLDCTGAEPTLANIQDAISAGLLSEGVLDYDLTQLFTMRMKTGEFDPPSKVAYTKITKAQIQSPAHQALAEKVAANDLVLLQNKAVAGTSSPLLPADPARLSNVVIVGNLAGTVTLGDYSGDPSLQVNAVQGITAAVQAANPGATVTYDACGTSTTATAPAACSAATLAAVKSASLVIVVAGTDLNVATEGHDRTSLAMPGNYDSLISQVSAVGNPNMALVIQSGGPVDISDVQGDFPAIVFSGYNGESQGTALAQVLFGQQDPAGHLDFTWYASDSQLPDIANYGLTPGQTGGLGRTYMYFTGTPTYPFGYGLSYTTFGYSHVKVGPKKASPDGTVKVSFDVTNTGRTAGTTVAQLYATPKFTVPGTELPASQLVGFRKTASLAPGQTQRITLRVKVSALSQWDESTLKQTVYNGPYQFSIGPDSATAAGSGTVTVRGTITPHVQYVTVQPGQTIYTAGQTLDLTGTNPWIGPDTDASLEQPHAPAAGIVEAVNNDQSFVNLATARVKYSSSDPSVASVTSGGLLRAIKNGTATITVTVNGVSGSVPVVVQGTLTDSVPSIMQAGSAATVTSTFTNGNTVPVAGVTAGITVPAGWTATPHGSDSVTQVAADSAATFTWTLSPPASAAPGSYTIGFTAGSGEGSYEASSSVQVPYASVTAAYDNTGISNDGQPFTGSFDGGALSWSAQALAAGGFAPGAQVTGAGIGFTWPQPGVPDNIVASGQVVPVSGSGELLGFLGASTNGNTSGTGTVVYSDGSTQPFTLNLADWWSATAVSGSSIAATADYINSGPTATQDSQTVHVYAAWVSLDPSKSVQYVILPDVTPDGSVSGAAMHIFGIGISPGGDQTATVCDTLGAQPSPSGLVTEDEGDGHLTSVTAGGLPATTTTGSGSLYMYFDIDNSVVPGGQYQATAYVSYFDQGTSNWDIQYDSYADVSNNAFRDSAFVTDTGSNTWKTAAIALPDAAFSDRENGSTDFRLNIGVGAQDIGRVGLAITGSNVVPVALCPAGGPTAPAVTVSPADAAVAAGSTATFTAQATGDPSPAVQWEQLAPGGDWTDVPGATATTLTVTDVAASADGTQYRALFTNDAGATASAPATLHVS